MSVGGDATSSAVPVDAALLRTWGLSSSYLLFVGTREPRKDLSTLLSASALLPDAPPLVLAGPAGWGPRLDLGGCLTTGYLADDVPRRVVAAADLLVLLTRDEGFGPPLHDAAAAGTPVVTSDLPVLRAVGDTVVRYAQPGHPRPSRRRSSQGSTILRPRRPCRASQARWAHASPHAWARTADLIRADVPPRGRALTERPSDRRVGARPPRSGPSSPSGRHRRYSPFAVMSMPGPLPEEVRAACRSWTRCCSGSIVAITCWPGRRGGPGRATAGP